MDAEFYAQELTKAAEAGQWERYKQIQQALAAETTAAMMQPYAPAIQKLLQAQGLEEAERNMPGFKAFRNSPDFQRTLEARPALKRALEAVETDLAFSDDKQELYKLSYDLHQASQQGSTPQQWTQSPGETRPGQATPDLSTSEKRRRYIQELETRGIKDTDLDRADPTYGKVAR